MTYTTITNQTTKDGRKISIAIKILPDGEVQEINEVTSVHGKESGFFLYGMNNAKEGGLEKALRYVDKEKALEWLALSPPKGDDTTKQEPNSVAKLIINFDNTKFGDEKSANLSEIPELSFRTDREGNPIGDGDWHMNYYVREFPEYPQISSRVDKNCFRPYCFTFLNDIHNCDLDEFQLAHNSVYYKFITKVQIKI